MQTLQSLPDLKGIVEAIAIDVTDDASIHKAAEHVEQKYSRLDCSHEQHRHLKQTQESRRQESPKPDCQYRRSCRPHRHFLTPPEKVSSPLLSARLNSPVTHLPFPTTQKSQAPATNTTVPASLLST